MVIVSVAEWLAAPAPLVDADTDKALVPSGVPGFDELLFPPPQEARPVAANKSIRMPRSLARRSGLLRLAAKPSITPKNGKSTA